jgi:site-specific recombinase XerD
MQAVLSRYQLFLAEWHQKSCSGRRFQPQYHNLLVRHCLLILNLSTAARPVTEMYGRRHDYSLELRFIRLTDKEGRSVSSARMVPLTGLAVRQLRIWEQHLEFLAHMTEPGLASLSQSAQQALSGQGPLFFWYQNGECELVTPGNMMDHFDRLFPFPPNWHRHAVRSHLLAQQVPVEYIDAMLGHEEMGAEYLHPCSSAPLSDLFQLSGVLEQWLQSLGLEVLDAWTTR